MPTTCSSLATVYLHRETSFRAGRSTCPNEMWANQPQVEIKFDGVFSSRKNGPDAVWQCSCAFSFDHTVLVSFRNWLAWRQSACRHFVARKLFIGAEIQAVVYLFLREFDPPISHAYLALDALQCLVKLGVKNEISMALGKHLLNAHLVIGKVTWKRMLKITGIHEEWRNGADTSFFTQGFHSWRQQYSNCRRTCQQTEVQNWSWGNSQTLVSASYRGHLYVVGSAKISSQMHFLLKDWEADPKPENFLDLTLLINNFAGHSTKDRF